MREAGPVDGATECGAQVDRSIGAEVRILPTCFRIEGHKKEIMRCDKYARVIAVVVLPVRHAAMLPSHVPRTFESIVCARVVRPDHFTCSGVERRDLAQGSAEIDEAVDHE